MEQSELPLQQALDLVRGSHLLLPAISRYGHMLEVPGECRIVFVLPYQGKTLLGTTEVRQSLAEPIECSDEEQAYLLRLYNHYFDCQLSDADVESKICRSPTFIGWQRQCQHGQSGVCIKLAAAIVDCIRREVDHSQGLSPDCG